MFASVLSVPSLISLVDMVCDLDPWVSHFEVDEPQTLSVFEKRGASVSLEHEQRKKANLHGNESSS